MFHLFNKVYMTFDTVIDNTKHRIVISKDNGHPIGYPEDPYDSRVVKSHMQALSVQDIVGKGQKFATYETFFEYIRETAGLITDKDNQLIIYCDKNTAQQLFIAWHKLILKRHSVDDMWKMWLFFVDKYSYVTRLTHLQDNVFDDINVLQWNKDTFVALYETIDVQPSSLFVSTVLQGIGIEYLLSTYFVDPTPQLKQMLNTKLCFLHRRLVQGELYDSKMDLLKNSQCKELLDYLGIDPDISPTTISTVFNHPKFSIFVNPELWNEAGTLVASNEEGKMSLNMGKLDSTTALAFVDAFRDFKAAVKRSDIREGFLSHSVQKISWLVWTFTGQLSDAKFDELVVDPVFNADFFVDPDDLEKVNVLFIDFAIRQYKNGNKRLLHNFCLA